MRNRKLVVIIISLFVLVAGIITTAFIISGFNNRDNGETEYVTITFDCGEGKEIEAKKVIKGDQIGALEDAACSNQIFVGWYKDANFSEQVYESDIVDTDITLYAAFTVKEVKESVSESTEAYLSDCSANYSVVVISEEEITESNLNEFVQISSAIGKMPSGFNVTNQGNEYTISPKTNYSAGCQYDFTALKDITFKGQSEAVKEYKFRIHKDKIETAKVKNSLKYVSWADVVKIGDKGTYLMDNTVILSKGIKVGDTIMFGDGTNNVTDDIEIVKVAKLESTTYRTIITATSAELSDVFDSVDIYYEDAITNQFLAQLDKEKMISEIKNSDAVEKITKRAALMLLSSKSFRDEYAKAMDSSESGADYFMNKASLKDTAETLSIKLKDAVEIEITIGDAENENFSNPNPDCWGGLKFSFSYDGDIGDYLKVKCQFDFTQYLNISCQGFHEGSGTDLVFDYAINCYSQTELSFKALMCSTSPDDPEEEEYIDITEEIDNLTEEEEEEEDPDTLLAELLKFMDDDGDYIRLVEVPFFIIEHPVPEILPLFQVNLTLNFVFDIKFGAAFSTKFVVLDAEQIGFRNTDEQKNVEAYKNKLDGADRYGLTIEICGYIGFKAGIEGQFSLSFAGLKELGEIGMGLAFGVYSDFYGYARYDLSKISTTVQSRLTGGVYLELGIYIELNIFAKSNIFKVRASVSLAEVKIPLLKVGDQYLLIKIQPYESKIVMKNATITTDEISSPKGLFVDLKTGEIEERDMDWNDFVVSTNVNYMKINSTDGVFSEIKENYVPVQSNYNVFTLFLRYKSSGLSFAVESENYYGVDVYRIYNDQITNIDVLGKECNIDYYMTIDGGEKQYITSRKVYAGNYANTCYTSIDQQLLKTHNYEWDINPTWTIVNGDTSFTIKFYSPKVCAMFIYFDGSINKWVGEYRIISIYDKPESFVPASTTDVTFKSWISKSTDGNPVKINTKGQDFAFADPKEYLSKLENTYYCYYENDGYDSKSNIKVTGDSESDVQYQLQYSNYGFNKYTSYIYTEEYGLAEHDVTIVYKDENNVEKTVVEKVTHGKTLQLKEYGTPEKQYLSGYSETKNGDAQYNFNSEITINANKTLYAVYSGKKLVIVLDYWNEETRKFKSETIDIVYGAVLNNDILKPYEKGMTLKEGVTMSEFTGWSYYYLTGSDKAVHQLKSNQIIENDMHLFPNFTRRVQITIDPAGGEVVNKDIYTEDIPMPTLIQNESYELYLHNGLVSHKDDNQYSYTLKEYVNKATGEVYTLDKMYHFPEPITLTAVWEKSEIEYTIEVDAVKWQLDSGNRIDSMVVKKVDLETKIEEIVNQYKNRTYDIISDDIHKYTFTGIEITRYDDVKRVRIYFDCKIEYVKCTTTFIYDNGDENQEIVTTYNTEFTSLGSPFDYQNQELKAHFIGWDTNEDGVVDIQPGGKYVVLGNNIVRALWEKTYFEYTITFILDYKTIATHKYHYNDLIVLPDIPEEYDGYVIDGWYDGTKPMSPNAKAANYSLYAYATAVYTYYELNGVVYSEPIFTKYGSTNKLLAKPEFDHYIVSDWTSDDVTITNGEYVMPAKDVTFKATKTPEEFNVSYYIDDILVKTEKYGYETYNYLFTPETRENYKFTGWKCSDVVVIENGFSMPAKDIRFDGTYEEDLYSNYKNVLFYVNDSLYDLIRVENGEEVTVPTLPFMPGFNFSGWMCDTNDIVNNKFVKTEALTIVYCYVKMGTVEVELILEDKGVQTTYSKLYGNPGDVIELPQLTNIVNREWNYNSSSYFGNFTIPEDVTEIDLIATVCERTYKVNITNFGYFYGSTESVIYAKPGDTVTLPDIICFEDSMGSYQASGWLSTNDINIQYSALTGKYTFTMPSNDVYCYTNDDATGEDTYTIEFYYNDLVNKKEFLVGKVINSALGYASTDYYSFNSIQYTKSNWHYQDGTTVSDLMDITAGTVIKLYCDVTVPKVLKEEIKICGESMYLNAKIGNTYIYPHHTTNNFVNTIELNPDEGYEYTPFMGFINSPSGKDVNRFFVNEDSVLECFYYKTGNYHIIIELYNEDILNEFYYANYELFVDKNEKLYIPSVYDTAKYSLSISVEIDGGTITNNVQMLSDETGSYIMLPQTIQETDWIYVRLTLNPITE